MDTENAQKEVGKLDFKSSSRSDNGIRNIKVGYNIRIGLKDTKGIGTCT